MKKTKKIIFFVLLAALLTNCVPTFYFGKPVKGVVLDEQGQPIEGAVALLIFTMEITNFHGTKTVPIYLKETVTDNKGRYRFPWWFAKRKYVFGWKNASENPVIEFYKVGYERESITNRVASIGLPSVYAHTDMTESIVMKPYDLKNDDLLHWFRSYASYVAIRVCKAEVMPKYIEERNKYYLLVNPERKLRGLHELKAGLGEKRHCK